MRFALLLLLSVSSALPQAGETAKAIDDVEWQLKFGDIATFDKFTYTGKPPAREKNPTAQGAGNPMILYGVHVLPEER